MGSTVRHGFSTLNRLLGKKNKDASLSKSNSNLNVAPLDMSSQQNKIVPLSAASSNAPFEQTFRITIALPRDQLYVVRVGAKTRLDQLLDTVCASKQLDKRKFEFRHPDGTQTFDLQMTIGEVGLNEIRLADKTDKSFIKFNTDDIMKLRHLSRESLTSSSDFSKSSARQYSKTVSPYSSTNSLNSMDSANGGGNGSSNGNGSGHHRHNLQQQHTNHLNNNNHRGVLGHPPIAPQRKKRIAPKPPGFAGPSLENERNSIGGDSTALSAPRRSMYASTPNLNGGQKDFRLSRAPEMHDSNGNIEPTMVQESDVQLRNGHSNGNLHQRAAFQSAGLLPNRMTVAGSTPHLIGPVAQQRSRTSSDSSEIRDGAPPTPRQRTFIAAKKKAPAPPPRLIVNGERTPSTPIIEEITTSPTVTTPITPTPLTPLPMLNGHNNVSKVMLNVESTTEDNAPNARPVIEIDSRDLPSLRSATASPVDVETTSAPLQSTGNAPQSLESSVTASSSLAERSLSSSDEDETNVYNIRTGIPTVSIVTSPAQTTAVRTTVSRSEPTTTHPVVDQHKSLTMIGGNSEAPTEDPVDRPDSPLWTYPLPAPQNFADSAPSKSSDTSTRSEQSSTTEASVHACMDDTPIKVVIHERAPLDFDSFSERTLTAADAEVTPTATASKAEGHDETDRATLTSDVEDGYQQSEAGTKFSTEEALIDGLERRRELFIERQFEFLTNADDSDRESSNEDQDKTASASSPVVRSGAAGGDLLHELKTVMRHDGGVESLLRSNSSSSDQSAPIAGNGDNVLSNFSIQSYSNGESKRESITRFDGSAPRKSSVVVNRSDSFHSTRPESTPTTNADDRNDYASLASTPHAQHQQHISSTALNGLTPRSSSYISLIGAHRFDASRPASFRTLDPAGKSATYARSTSSELSIADSPSLSSLSVMKSILSNSRKNSLSSSTGAPTIIDDVEPLRTVELNQPDAKVQQPADKNNDISGNNAPVGQLSDSSGSAPTAVVTTQPTAIAEPVPVRPEPKKWHYQGPPSINVSTWGERPKSTIAIKSDSDYKLSDPSNSRPIPPKPVAAAPAAAPLPTPTPVANSQNVRQPIAKRKPDGHYVASTTQINRAPSPASPQPPQPQPAPVIVSIPAQCPAPLSPVDMDRPIIRGVVPKVSSTFIGGDPTTNGLDDLFVRRPSYDISTYVAPDHTAMMQLNTMTLGRVAKPTQSARWSAASSGTVPVPFKVAAPVRSTATAALLTRYAISNPTQNAQSDAGYDSGYKSMPPVYSELNAKLSSVTGANESPPSSAPFSQFTLRKTGLKDRILAEADTRGGADQKPAPTVRQQTVELRSSTANGARRPFSVPVFAVNANAADAVIPAPPAPAMPAFVPVKRTTVMAAKSPTDAADPQDQLLQSIRNFNKTKLRKQRT